MITYEGIDRNFRFLAMEVRRQLETVYRLLDQPSPGLIGKVLMRDHYTDTLKALIEKKCISYFRHTRTIDDPSANLVSALNVSTSNLERIADFCVNLALQVQQLQDPALLGRFRFKEYFAELFDVLPLISDALASPDTGTALRICRAEDKLDQLYGADFDDIRNALRTGQNVDDLLHCLYIAHYLERMGDALLNVGEAILFAATGEKIKLHEYLGLRDALTSQQPESTMGDYSIEFGWETRSGCRIAKVEEKSGDGELEAIFKKGGAQKLHREHANIIRWEQAMPGLAPKVLEFQPGDEDAALLLEFLEGLTLRDLVLNGQRELVDQALDQLETTLTGVWETTLQRVPANAHFVDQAIARLDEVFQMHPGFVNASYEVGSLSVPSLEELLKRAGKEEERLDAPFRVLVHGDLNADNIIFDHRAKRLHFVDLYRSCESDYVQDVSILLVSNFRLPVFGGDIRGMLNHVVQRMYRFARSFSESHEDRTFDVRLALGLARALITSTRFEMDRDFAQAMYSRAVYLLGKVIDLAPANTGDFKVSTELLVY